MSVLRQGAGASRACSASRCGCRRSTGHWFAARPRSSIHWSRPSTARTVARRSRGTSASSSANSAAACSSPTAMKVSRARWSSSENGSCSRDARRTGVIHSRMSAALQHEQVEPLVERQIDGNRRAQLDDALSLADRGGMEERLQIAEVVVDQPKRDAGPLGDAVGRGLEVALLEQRKQRVDDRGTGARRTRGRDRRSAVRSSLGASDGAPGAGLLAAIAHHLASTRQRHRHWGRGTDSPALGERPLV